MFREILYGKYTSITKVEIIPHQVLKLLIARLLSKSGTRLLKFVLKSMFTSIRFCLIKKTIVDFEVRLARGSSEKFIVVIVEHLPMGCSNGFLFRCLCFCHRL